MLVIADNGDKLGLLSLQEALSIAKDSNLDLVLVAPEGKPPVAKLENYGKKRFKTKKQKTKTKQLQIKELRLKPRIDQHDVGIKVKKAREFLMDGHKVQFTMMFKGRELAHTEFGLAVLQKIEAELADIGKIERAPTREGSRLIMIVAKGSKKSEIKRES